MNELIALQAFPTQGAAQVVADQLAANGIAATIVKKASILPLAMAAQDFDD